MKEKQRLLEDLVKQPNENEWVEFKLNVHSAEEIGKSISVLSTMFMKSCLPVKPVTGSKNIIDAFHSIESRRS